MKIMNNYLDDAWFVDSNKSTSRISTINIPVNEYEFVGPREIIIRNNKCECGQNLEREWRYCPRCGGKLAWEQ